MAAFKLPNPLERRHLIERDLSPAQATRVAEAYRAEGRSLDALDFLHAAGDAEGLAALRCEAVRHQHPWARCARTAACSPADRPRKE